MKGASILLAIIVLFILLQCKDPLIDETTSIPQKPGTVRILLKDFPLADKQVQQVWVTILSVEIHSESEGWIRVVDNSPTGKAYELMELSENVAQLGISDLTPGLYTQIRLTLGEENRVVVLDNGETLEHPLIVPSGQKTGIKLTGDFEIISGSGTEILLDFDAQKSVVLSGNDTFLLKPTVAVEEVREITELMLIEPPSGAIVETDNPYYRWTSVAWANQYQIKVGLNPTLTSYQISSYTIDTAGHFGSLKNNVYYWAVRAQDNDGVWRDWTPINSFAIAGP